MASVVHSTDDIADLWFFARKAAAALERRLERALREELGISLAQYGLLSALSGQDCAINQQAVAELLGLTKSSVSRQIESAAESGLVVSAASEVSRRERTVELSPAGAEMVRRGDALLAASIQDGDAHGPSGVELDPEDLAITLRTLRSIS